jgi:beta-glucanase (GH16 family)
MALRNLALFSLVLILGMGISSYAAYSLVWSDEFDGTTLNTANWECMIGGGGWGNAELEYYRAENATVADGNLIITAKEESYGGYNYTSARIRSKNKKDFLYGRMEGRIKVPTGGGMWPAFWMMPTYDVYGGWSYSGEMDIMETRNNTDYIGGALHYGGAPHVYSSGSYSPGGVDFSDDFHIYAIEWEPDVIRWYVDDIYYFTVTSATWYSDGAPSNNRAPFDEYFHFLLNVAVGGKYTNCTDPGCITATFPQQMIVDYVKVYQDPDIMPNNPPTVTITSPTEGANPPVGDILIQATASDSDGYITSVKFYNGNEYLGEDTTAPYSFNWTGVTNGCYTIIVDANDDDNAVSSDMVDITVGSGCPQYTYNFSGITSPSSSHKAADGEIDVDDATIENGTFSARRDTIPGWALWAEATTAEYANLVSSNDTRYQGADPGSGDNAAMIFEFYITQNPTDIIKLNVSVELGRASAEDLGWVYLWNYNTHSYTVLGSQSGTADMIISANILSNPGDYVEPGTGQLTVFVVDEDTSDWIQIDNISVTVYTQPPTTGIRGDLNVDGIVDFQDLGIMADEWLTDGTTADIEPAEGDGIVDFRDFAVLAENWLKSI